MYLISIIFIAIVWRVHAEANVAPQFTIAVMKDQMALLLRRVIHMQKVLENGNNKTTEKDREVPDQLVSLQIFKDCKDYYEMGYTKSGVYMIQIFKGFFAVPVFCDMETTSAFSGKKGWMTIQRRMNGEVNFDRGWNEYLNGFGFPDKEHWIGLRNLLSITRQNKIGKYDNNDIMIRMDMEDWDGVHAFMEHNSLVILSEEFDFEIRSLGRYAGTEGLNGPLEYSLSSPFSTSDHNNDRQRNKGCVQNQKGGWWFGFCNNLNLNGIYSQRREIMTRNKMFIHNWRNVNPKNTALRYVSIKLQ